VTAAVNGRLRLEAARRGERTVLTGVYRTVPFHPGPVQYRHERAEVIVQDVSPGIFPGDRLEIDVTVNEGAALTVSGQSATKIYAATRGVSSEVSTVLRVGHGATLWWLPGDIIPFRDAIYTSRTNVVLDDGARFALLEIITPGRVAMGEREAYQRLDLRLRIDVGGKPVLMDRSVLDPKERPLSSIGSHGDFACSGLLAAVGYPVPPDPEDCANKVWIGVDGDRDIVVARGLAQAAAPLREALRSLLTRLDHR
jgi:urease accessory protein